MNDTFAIRDYPLVIEPTVQLLEGRAGHSALGIPNLDLPSARRLLYRLSPQQAQELPLPANMGLVFGDAVDVDACRIVLGYDTGGGLTHWLLRSNKNWECQELPVELTGRAVRRPSLRLVFHDEVCRRRFLELLPVMPERLGLTEPPWLIEIWTLPDEVTEDHA